MPETLSVSPVALDRELLIHLSSDLRLAPLAVTPAFFAPGRHDKPELSDGRILGVFDYTDTWSYWERHPTGDELVYVIAGAVDFLLVDERDRRVATLRPGDGAIVPIGTWHRAVIEVPTQMLFVTPTPARTEQLPVRADDEWP